MKHLINRVEDIKIAYIGGGSRGWAWGLMSDLISVDDISGTVALYDIDRKAAEANVIIGNKYNTHDEAKTRWDYCLAETLEEALTGADFVIISILLYNSFFARLSEFAPIFVVFTRIIAPSVIT